MSIEEKANLILKKIERMDTFFNSSMEKIKERDNTIKDKDLRIKELTDKLVVVSKEKDEALWAKIKLMKSISSEREEMFQKMSEIQKDITIKEQKINKLKQKSRAAQDGLMGSSFEQDRLKKEVEEKVKSLIEIQEKVASVSSGSTGIVYDTESAMEYFEERIAKANRSLHIVVPTISFMEETGLMEKINQLPDKCVVNIATALDMGEHQVLISNWKERGWYIYNYKDKNFLMLSANGADTCIAYIARGKISGFYSNISDLVTIFKQALMYPFIRGQKL